MTLAATGELASLRAMQVADALRFIESNHHCVLATTRRDGHTQLSPVVASTDSEGRVVISTRATARKVDHLTARPFAVLCVMNDAFFGPSVQVEGSVEIVRLPEAMAGLIDYYRRVAGEHEDWDAYRNAMITEQRVLLRLSRSNVPDRTCAGKGPADPPSFCLKFTSSTTAKDIQFRLAL